MSGRGAKRPNPTMVFLSSCAGSMSVAWLVSAWGGFHKANSCKVVTGYDLAAREVSLFQGVSSTIVLASTVLNGLYFGFKDGTETCGDRVIVTIANVLTISLMSGSAWLPMRIGDTIEDRAFVGDAATGTGRCGTFLDKSPFFELHTQALLAGFVLVLNAALVVVGHAIYFRRSGQAGHSVSGETVRVNVRDDNDTPVKDFQL